MQRKKRLDIISIFFPIMILVMFVACVTIATEATFSEGLRFLLFQIAGILIPGCALSIQFSKINYNSISFTIYSYALGYSINILTYFLFMPWGCKELIPYAVLLECVAGIIILYVKRERLKNISIDSEGAIICAVAFLLMATFRFFFSVGANILPIDGVTVSEAIHKDTLFHTGDTISAARSFPLMDYRWYTERFFYHVFSNIHMAVNYLSTGISAFILDGYFRGIESAFLFSYGFYSLLSNLGLNTKLKTWGMIAGFFTSGLESYVCAYYSGHLYYESIGFDVGLAFAIMAISAFVIQVRSEDTNIQAIALAMIFFTTGVGGKGPCALLAMVGMGCVCIYWLFSGKPRRGLANGIILILLFMLVFFTILSNGFEALRGGSGGNGLEFPVPLKAMRDYPIGDIYDRMRSFGCPRIISALGMLGLWAILVQPAAFLLTCFVFIYRGITARSVKTENIMLLGGWLCGVILVLTSWQHGCSEMYFIMASFPFGVAYTAFNYDEISINRNFKKGLVILLTVSGICFFIIGTAEFWKKGVGNLLPIQQNTPGVEVANTIRDSEYDAYIWVRDNTPEDSLILSNIYLSGGGGEGRSNYLTCVLCERFGWLDGWIFVYYHDDEIWWKIDVLYDLFAGNDVKDIIKREEIDYIIHVKSVSPDFNPPEYLEPVYDNDGVTVFKVIK